MSRQRPINKDFSIIPGVVDGVLTPSAIKSPRLERRRGRFKLPQAVPRIRKISYLAGVVNSDEVFDVDRYENVEVTEDSIRNSSFKPKAKDEKIADDGGEFTHYTIKYLNEDAIVAFDTYPTEDNDFITYSGHVWTETSSFTHDGVSIVDSILPPDGDLDASLIGPKLWGLMAPVRPVMDLGVALAELRDLPHLLKTRLSDLKHIADVHLAVQFGWRPLLNDIRNMLSLRQRIIKRLDFIKRNAGKPVHRFVDLPDVVDDIVLDSWTGRDFSLLSSPTSKYDFNGDYLDEDYITRLTLTKTVKTRATGVFVYYLDDAAFPHDEYLEAKLSGVILTPHVMWSALPWTWLVDWFSNAGDILSNLQNQIDYRLVSTYAYSQVHTERKYTWASSNPDCFTSVSRIFDTKIRRRIHPFGLEFGSSLTDLQSSIIAALALTRV